MLFYLKVNTPFDPVNFYTQIVYHITFLLRRCFFFTVQLKCKYDHSDDDNFLNCEKDYATSFS